MHNAFQQYVEHLYESDTLDAFRAAINDAAIAFELPCFAYLRMPRASRASAVLISTYPTVWTDHYLRLHYERLDPVIQMAHAMTEPFEWGLGADKYELSREQRCFFDEASAFGIRCGFTIPIQDGFGPIAAVTFASSDRRCAFVRSIRMNASVLQLMAISLHVHARRTLWHSRTVQGKQLSPREMECLVWAARGKSAWATAKILGISDATVRFHLANVRSKLNVASTRQAIALLNRIQTQ